MINVEKRGVNYQQRSDNHRVFVARYQNSNKEIKKRKTFYCSQYGTKQAYKKAIETRKRWEKEFGVPKYYPVHDHNIIKFENNYYINEDYFILEVKHKEKLYKTRAKIDLKYIDKVKAHQWHYGRAKTTEHIATWNNNNEGKRKKLYLSKLLFPNQEGVINHLNRDKWDFREKNIKFLKSPQYAKARVYDESDTAIPGVHYFVNKKSGIHYWVASYNRGKFNKKRMFSISKYGDKQAKHRATEQRLEWEEYLDEEL